MKLLAAPLITAAIFTGIPASAEADRSDCPKKLEREYSKHYRQVVNRLGRRAPGRNIRKHGVLFRKVAFDAVCSELRRSDRQLKQLLISPAYSYSRAVPPARPPSGVKTDYTESVGGSSNPMVNPYCESSGNPQATGNPGYWGWYQFDYGTWVAHGGAPSQYGNAPLYIQHQVAARVGYDAWPNC